jgi:hypothetical protein
MFGGQHRIDEAETARAGWGDTREKRQPQRRDPRATGKVCSCTEKIRIKSLEMVGVVRDNVQTGQVDPGTQVTGNPTNQALAAIVVRETFGCVGGSGKKTELLDAPSISSRTRPILILRNRKWSRSSGLRTAAISHAEFAQLIQRWRTSSAMKVQRISVRVAQTGRGCGKAGFAKCGPQVERSPHRRREPPDLFRGHAHVRARTLARRQQRVCD